MKLAKNINGSLSFIEIEDGKEVDGQRSEAQLIADGYKKACPYLGTEEGAKVWMEYAECWVEELVQEMQQDIPDLANLPDDAELTAEQALQIITGE